MLTLNRIALRRREALARRARWQTLHAIAEAPSQEQRAYITAERAAIRWALRIIDACPEIANRFTEDEYRGPYEDAPVSTTATPNREEPIHV